MLERPSDDAKSQFALCRMILKDAHFYRLHGSGLLNFVKFLDSLKRIVPQLTTYFRATHDAVGICWHILVIGSRQK